MIKKGISGGMISLNSILNKNVRLDLANASMIRTSSTIREAAKIGLQSLYANADEVLERYKDFDIIKEMKSRKEANLLWVRARAIDADIVNTNGDYFSEEELTKETEYQGKKMPVYKTFEGVPIYTNHKNDKIEDAKGMVVYAEWDEDEKCVYVVFFIDEDAYPDIARGVRQGYIHDVSMGCFPKGTKVLTNNGYKSIEHITDNDLLVDSNGDFTNIVNKQIKLEEEKLYKINFEGGFYIRCTKEHPLLAVDKTTWQKRVKRNKNSKPQRVYNDVVPDLVEAQNLKRGDLLAIKSGGEITPSDLTAEKAALLGLFAAEGNYLKYKNEIKEVEFSFALDEKETLVQECVNLFKLIFGVDARVYERIPRNTIVVRVYSPEIANWFKYHVGEYSYSKSLSQELLFADFEIQRSFICNWIKGDGCITHKPLKSNGISATTCSPEMVQGIIHILTRLGLYHKVYAKFENKTYSFTKGLEIYNNSKGFDGRHMSFNVELPSYEASKISQDCNFICKISDNPQCNKNYTGDFILRKITSIEEEKFYGPVYNFETESHTYTVSNINVHNCSVELGVCSICGNEATTEKDYCDCLKKYKGKMHPTGKKAFEYNYGIKFIELSCVGDGAFESCEILELYDQDELLEKAQKNIKAAHALHSAVTLAASINNDIGEQREIEGVLRQLTGLTREIIRVSQTAGTLVGGQLMSGSGAQNATVVKILQGLGIDPSSSLNILDLVNLALNFLEVAVMNLFSRKDNIDLGHVAKLTKAMGELQNTLQDMIDDGIETSGQRNSQPMIPAQQPQMPAQNQATMPPSAGVPQMQAQTTEFKPSVGTLIEPFSQQPFVMPLGGGVTAQDSQKIKLVWASSGEEITENKEQKLNKIGKFIVALNNLKEACVNEQNNKGVLELPQKNNMSTFNGDTKIMDHFKKIARDLKEQQNENYTVAVDISLNDNSGNRVVLSTNDGIKGYHNNKLVNWKPELSDEQISQMESGEGYKVAAAVLKNLAHTIKTASNVDDLLVMDEQISSEREDHSQRVIVDINDLHKKVNTDMTMQEKLDKRRRDSDTMTVTNEMIDSKRTNELVRIVTELRKDATKCLGDTPLEEMIHPNFGKSTVPGKKIMSSVMSAVAKTCVASKSSPQDVLTFLVDASQDKGFGTILKLARLGTASRQYDALMSRTAQAELEQLEEIPDNTPGMDAAPPMDDMPPLEEVPMEETAVTEIADTVEPEATEGEIISALNVIKDNFETAVEKLTELLDKMGPSVEPSKEDEMKDALTMDDDEMDDDSMKGAVTGLSLAGEEMDASPGDMVDTINPVPTNQLAEDINEARLPQSAMARSRSRHTKKASKKDIYSVTVGWLADVANQNDISSEKIALASKLFCSYSDAAKGVLAKTIKSAAVKVVDETTHSTTIYATLEDIGADVKDASFNQKFRDFAVSLLGGSGYEVDPTTFALTDIDVSEDGTVCGKVSTRATKTFNPELEPEVPIDNYFDKDRISKSIEVPVGDVTMPEAPMSEPLAEEVIMTASAKANQRMARLQNIVKIAQGLGMPGSPMGGGQPAPMDPLMGTPGMAGGGADLGVGSLTGSTPEEGVPQMDAGINESPEPGNKAPWGTICPQCGSKDIDIANGEGSCNSCGAQLKFKFIVESTPADESKPEDTGLETPPMETPAPPVGGIGGGEGMTAQPNAMQTGAPGMAGGMAGGMPAMASPKRIITRVAYKTTPEVFLRAAADGFNKLAADKLPVGMICPKCGSRTAQKDNEYTYCYDCDTMSISTVKKSKNEKGVLNATITWF